MKKIQFIILRDSTGKIQVTIEKNDENQKFNEIISNLTVESTILVRGYLKDSPMVKLNGMELIPNHIEILTKASSLPININDEEVSRSVRHDFRFLDLRNEKNRKIFEIKTAFENGLRKYCNSNGFIELHSPKI